MDADERRRLLLWLRTPRSTRQILKRLRSTDCLGLLRAIPVEEGEIFFAPGYAGEHLGFYWTRGKRDSKKALRVLGTNEVDTGNARLVNP